MEWAPVFRVLSHELRAPTAVVAGYARLLREGRLPEPDRLQALAQIEQAAGRLSQFGRQASDLARWLIPPGDRMTAVPAGELLDRATAVSGLPASRIIRADGEGAHQAAISCLDAEAVAAAVASAMEAAAREAIDAPIRVAMRRVPDGSACDVLVGPAESAAWNAEVPGPETGDPPGIDRGGMGLAFILAAAIAHAHGGQLWSVGGRQGLVGLRLLISRG